MDIFQYVDKMLSDDELDKEAKTNLLTGWVNTWTHKMFTVTQNQDQLKDNHAVLEYMTSKLETLVRSE